MRDISFTMMEKGGVGSLIVYVMIITIVAMISLAFILHMFLVYTPKNEVSAEFYLGNEKVSEIHCTLIDNKNYAYYDYENNPAYLDVVVKKNGKPATNTYVTLSGCGISQEMAKTDYKGTAHLSLVGVNLPPGINSDQLEILVLGKHFYVTVVRG